MCSPCWLSIETGRQFLVVQWRRCCQLDCSYWLLQCSSHRKAWHTLSMKDEHANSDPEAMGWYVPGLSQAHHE